MRRPKEMVQEFHVALDLPVRDEPQLPLSSLWSQRHYRDTMQHLLWAVNGATAIMRQAAKRSEHRERALRIALLVEEIGEYLEAEMADDPVMIADALADMEYIIQGTGLTYGLKLDQVFAEVHRSNMTKVGGGKDASGKVIKPDTYTPPNIEAVLWLSE